jgi:hypothetical protein
MVTCRNDGPYANINEDIEVNFTPYHFYELVLGEQQTDTFTCICIPAF